MCVQIASIKYRMCGELLLEAGDLLLGIFKKIERVEFDGDLLLEAGDLLPELGDLLLRLVPRK